MISCKQIEVAELTQLCNSFKFWVELLNECIIEIDSKFTYIFLSVSCIMNERGNPLKFDKSAMNKTSIPVYSADPKQLIELCLEGDLEAVDKFLIAHSDMINIKEEQYGNVALHVAASRGNIPLLELLIRRGASLGIQVSKEISKF